uniref:Uncharacterized protein n=1 Tax=Panstrongylus lignarius TaxID=156445 RepID=A0A224XQS4_9HEMI
MMYVKWTALHLTFATILRLLLHVMIVFSSHLLSLPVLVYVLQTVLHSGLIPFHFHCFSLTYLHPGTCQRLRLQDQELHLQQRDRLLVEAWSWYQLHPVFL